MGHLRKIKTILRHPVLQHSRFSKANLIIFILIFAGIGGYILLSSHAASSLANVFVSPNGSDTGINCKRFTTAQANPDPAGTTLCKTFNRAFQLADSNDVVEVEAGAYIGPEYIYPNSTITSKVIFKPALNAAITIQDTSGHPQPVSIKASHVEFDNFPFGYTEFAGNATCGWSCPSHSYGLSIEPPSGSNGFYSCISDIVIKNSTGHSFAINNGVSDVSFIGGTWGNLGWQLGETSDHTTSWNAPAIGGSTSFKCPNPTTVGAAATNITFNGVHFGNNFPACQNAAIYGTNPTATCQEPSHPDCIHIFGETVGLHIENSWFDHCMGFYLEMNVENNYVVDGQALMKDALFENNIFGDDNAGGYDSWDQLAPGGTGPLYLVCDNVVFRNNTWGHNQAPNPLFAINCPLAAGASKGVQFYNNIFTNWGTSACPSTASFDHNLFISGSTCGTNAYTGAANFVRIPDNKLDSSYPWAATPWTSDFHITSGSAAIDKGLAADCPATDFEGDSRPLGSACDLGADELNPVTAGAANLWVDADGGSCTRSATYAAYNNATACGSMQAAMTAAQAGDIVIIKNGTYPGQTITSGTKSSAVSFYAETASQVLLTGNLSLDGVDKIHIYGVISAGSGESRDGLAICDTNCKTFTTQDILIDGFHGKNAFIRGTNVTVDHSEFGGFSACLAGNSEDGFRFWDGTGGSVTPTNDVLRNSVIHDIDDGVGDTCQGTVQAGRHVDCMQNNGGINLTIERDTFYNCPTSNIQDSNFSGATIGSILVQNNLFGPPHCCNSVAIGPAGGSGNDCSAIIVRYNTFDGGSINSTTCGSGSLGVQAYGNIFATNIFACGGGVNLRYNIFHPTDGPACGTNYKRCTPTFVDVLPAWGGSQPNPHLAATDSCAIDAGDPANYPITDIDNNVRPQGAAPDAGADEFTTASAGSSPNVPGDLTGDGHVTLLDLSILLSHYGQNASPLQGDLSGDGKVTLIDLSILLSHYGR